MAMRKSSDPEVQKLRDSITLQPGMKINKLTLLQKEGNGWKCKCDCGNTIVITRPYRLKNELIGNVQDHTGSCGCIQKKTGPKNANRNGAKDIDIKGQIFYNWKVIDQTDILDSNRSRLYICYHLKTNQYHLISKRHLDIPGFKCSQSYEKIQEQIKNNIKTPQIGSKQEENILNLLKENNIHGNFQYTFSDCKDKNLLPFDFYIENKYIIEYDGEQHFKVIDFFNGLDGFYVRRAHDLLKNKYCFEHNIPIIRIPWDIKYTINDLKLETTRFLLTPKNEKEYFESRK